jgi:hypothetical protein
MDTLCDTADLLFDLQHCNAVDQSTLPCLIERTRLLIEESNGHWRDRIYRYLQHVQDVPLENSLLRDEEGPLFDSSLFYDNIWTTHAYSLFNTTRILLLKTWKTLCNASNEPLENPILDEPNDSPVLGITSDIVGLAKEVIRSLDYCHHPSRQFMGTFRAVLPQDVAYACLDPESREAKFLESSCRYLFKGTLSDLFNDIGSNHNTGNHGKNQGPI